MSAEKRLLELAEKDRLKILGLKMKIEKLERQILNFTDIDNIDLSLGSPVYETIKLQNQLLREENKKIKVERNKAVRQLESFKKKMSKIIGPVEK